MPPPSRCAALGGLNGRLGTGTVLYAAESTRKSWQIRRFGLHRGPLQNPAWSQARIAVVYYVRAIISWCLSAIGALLLMLTACVALGAIALTIEGVDHVTELWVFVAILLAVTIAVNYGFDLLAAMLLPAASRGPQWLRDGLWGGRYAEFVPWTSAHGRVAKLAGYICWGLWLLIIVGVVIEQAVSRKFAGGQQLISNGIIGMVAYLAFTAWAVWMVMIGWKFVHDRLRPPPVDPGFNPIPLSEPLGEAKRDLDGAAEAARQPAPVGLPRRSQY